jgi:hypothetical protein
MRLSRGQRRALEIIGRRIAAWWARGPFSPGYTREDRKHWALQHEAWEDAMIAEQELHQANEDMCLPGDPPWLDVCEAVGDGHSHYVPRSLLPELQEAAP